MAQGVNFDMKVYAQAGHGMRSISAGWSSVNG